jgi:hypothetical protein
VPQVREDQFQTKILELCNWYRLLVYHTYDSRRSNPGFPDLVIVGKTRVIFAELKSTTGKVSMVQQEWHDKLNAAGAEAYIWRPEDWPQVEQVISELAGKGSTPSNVRRLLCHRCADEVGMKIDGGTMDLSSISIDAMQNSAKFEELP